MNKLIAHKFFMTTYGNLHVPSKLKLLDISTFLSGVSNIKLNYQVIVMLSIACLISSLLVYMLFYMYFKSRYEKKFDKWRLISDLLIRKAIFYDDEDEEDDDENMIHVTYKAKRLMNNKHFRRLVAAEIMSVKKNMSGTSADNLKKLYQQLHLEKYALQNLKSRYWHVKAKAIQELSIMEMNELVAELYPFTNNPNELVRMEAQTATVQFNGFEGLRFLDIITYPISDWQQIKLLQQLSIVPPSNISIDDWLKSTNNSVVVFALKLSRNYHRFELHDDIIACLDHPDSKVRLEAINYFCEIYTDETSEKLISRYLDETLKHRLAIIKALQNIGSEQDIDFLTSLLGDENYEIKLNAARALAKIGNDGLTTLQDHASTFGYPLDEMVTQIEGELAA